MNQGRFFSPIDGDIELLSGSAWASYVPIYNAWYNIGLALDAAGLKAESVTYTTTETPILDSSVGSCITLKTNCLEAKQFIIELLTSTWSAPALTAIAAYLGWPWPDDPDVIQAKLIVLVS